MWWVELILDIVIWGGMMVLALAVVYVISSLIDELEGTKSDGHSIFSRLPRWPLWARRVFVLTLPLSAAAWLVVYCFLGIGATCWAGVEWLSRVIISAWRRRPGE